MNKRSNESYTPALSIYITLHLRGGKFTVPFPLPSSLLPSFLLLSPPSLARGSMGSAVISPCKVLGGAEPEPFSCISAVKIWQLMHGNNFPDFADSQLTSSRNQEASSCLNVVTLMSTIQLLLCWRGGLVVSALDQRPRGRGFEPPAAGCRVVTVGQLLFAPWAWAYSTLHPLGVGKLVPVIAGKV